MTLRTLNYGNYGIFLIMGNAGVCPSTVSFMNPTNLGVIGPGCLPTKRRRALSGTRVSGLKV